tara:strand:- start:1131 stop:1505 length:375 start_codon:yes stop_codon:yes gene_type:complete
MSNLFKNYEECESVIIKMSSDLTDGSIKNIVLAINVCHSLQNDKDKIYRLTQTFIETLWDIPEAIEQGFHKYLRTRARKIKALFQYHNKHCPNNELCKVCEIMNNNKERMRNINERKRPELCSE